MIAIATIVAIFSRPARILTSSFILLVTMLFGLAASASAQIAAFTNNPVTTTYGGASDTGPGLNIGVTFHVSGSGIEVFQLGAFDWQGDGLNAAHTVTLFNNETALASVTVPAGTVAPLISGYRFQSLSTPILLPAGTYSVVSYQMNGTNAGNDPYGENNASGFNGSTNLSAGDGVYQFTTTGSPLYPNNVDNGYDFASASFTYTNIATANSIWTGGGADNNWSTAGNWNTTPATAAGLTFAGSTRLANNNDLTGFAANSITFDSAAGAFVLSGNNIALGGNIGFNANPAKPVTQTLNLNMAWGTDQTINLPANGNLALGGNITSDNNLTKIGTGTLTLGGVNAIENLDVNGGTNIITGNTAVNGNNVGYDRFYVADGDTVANCNGTLIIQPGAVLTVTGTFNDAMVIGRDSGSGTVIQNGGTFTFNPANNQLFLVGASQFASTRAEYHMNGGLWDLSNFKLGIGLGVNGAVITGAVYQVSGVITNVNDLDLGTLTPNGYGEYDLTGGSIYIGSGGITTYDNTYGLNLGGGTVGAEANWSSSLKMNLTGNNGSVTFNPAGNTITLSGVLSGTGGLIVTNSGTLELSGANNSYAGITTVSAGALQLDVAGNSSSAIHIVNGAMLNLNYSSTLTVPAFYTNGVALAGGVYTSANLPGFITGTGSLTVAASTPPMVNHPVVSGGNLILTGSGGTAGAGYTWLTTTNLVAPIIWTTNTTGTFDSNGNFSNAIPVSAMTPAKFFRLRTP